MSQAKTPAINWYEERHERDRFEAWMLNGIVGRVWYSKPLRTWLYWSLPKQSTRRASHGAAARKAVEVAVRDALDIVIPMVAKYRKGADED